MAWHWTGCVVALTCRSVRQRRWPQFSEYFECDAPTVWQVRDAIAHTLARWPVGSLGEPAEPGAAPDPA
jgi:hypothetical protein